MSIRVRLQDLPEQCLRLSRNHVANQVDAASVMFDKFHDPPAPGLVEDAAGPSLARFEWAPPSGLLQATHANELDATEDGAYAVALSTVITKGFVVQRRAHHGSGSDYLITRKGEPENDFYKLEVSGIARGPGGEGMRTRLGAKLDQLASGNKQLSRPGLAVVVGFEAARVLMGDQP